MIGQIATLLSRRPRASRQSTLPAVSASRFTLGPMLFQRLAVETGLSMSTVSVLFQILRLALEGHRVADFKSMLVSYSDLAPVRIDEALSFLSPWFDESASPRVIDAIAPLVRNLCGRIAAWYPALGEVPMRHSARWRLPRPQPAGPRVPGHQPALLIVTGFLGSGKSTLLNEMLQHPDLSQSLVFVNEIGTIPIDQFNVRLGDGAEDPVMLAGGCLCCHLGETFVAEINTALERRDAGELPWFERIVVETSGAADPSAIIRTVQEDTALRRRVRYAGTLATVDVTGDVRTLVERPEAAGQLASADWIVLTKTDLIDGEELARIQSDINDIRPGALLIVAQSPREAADRAMASIARRRTADGVAPMVPAPNMARSPHVDRLSVINLEVDQLDLRALRLFCDLLALAKGEDLFRIKGVVDIRDHHRTLLLQSVRGGAFDLTWMLNHQGPRGLVVIARGLEAAAVARLLAMATEATAAQAT